MSILLAWGRWLDRLTHRRLIRRCNLAFDPQWYLRQYPDVAGYWRDPFVHYIKHGRDEGRLAQRPSVDEGAYDTVRRVVEELCAIDPIQNRDARLRDIKSLPLSRGRSAGRLVQGVSIFFSKIHKPVTHVILVSGVGATHGVRPDDGLWIVTDTDERLEHEAENLCYLADLASSAPETYRLTLLDTILRLVKPASILNIDSNLGRRLHESLTEDERRAWTQA